MTIKKIKFPRLSWANRKFEEIDQNKSSVLKKVIIAGECINEGTKRPYLCKINLETSSADVIKVLSIDDKITQVNFGPYDNGYILIGL